MKSIALPIDQIKPQVIKSLGSNQLTIIETPTGSGKTMRLPKWCHEVSNLKNYTLVPRVVMAKEAMRGAAKIVWGNSRDVAYVTGRGDKGGKRALCTYITEGSFLARNIADRMKVGSFILVDEVHEQGARTEAVLRLCKKWMDKGLKVVLMSATMDTNKYSEYYTQDGYSVGVCSLPAKERPFPLTKITVDSPLKAISEAAKQGGRCLIGVDGKKTISDIIRGLKPLLGSIPVFPFHGELEQEEMDKPLYHKGAMVVVGTNVLQSGVTIEGLTHGWFNGIGNRIENNCGVTQLKRYRLSQAEMTQWYGRIGRTCNGVIFQSPSEEYAYSMRDIMPTPEILRVPLEETILNFLSLGLDIRDGGCLNQPSMTNVQNANVSLQTLGLIDASFEITKLGLDVQKEGVGIRGGIIIVIGRKYGLDNTAHKIALMAGGSHPFTYFKSQDYTHIVNEYNYSDLLIWTKVLDEVVLEFGYKVKSLDKDLYKEKMERNDIFRKSVNRLMRNWKRIDADYSDAPMSSEALKDAIMSIMKVAYANSSFEIGGYVPNVSRNSNVSLKGVKNLVGRVIMLPHGRSILGEITITEEHKEETTISKPMYYDGKIVTRIDVKKGNSLISQTYQPVSEWNEEVKNAWTNGITKFSYYKRELNQIAGQFDNLNNRIGGKLPSIDVDAILSNKLDEVQPLSANDFYDSGWEFSLENFISSEDIKTIQTKCPNKIGGYEVTYNGKDSDYSITINANSMSLKDAKKFPSLLNGRKVVFNNYWNNYSKDEFIAKLKADEQAALEEKLGSISRIYSVDDMETKEDVTFNGKTYFYGSKLSDDKAYSAWFECSIERDNNVQQVKDFFAQLDLEYLQELAKNMTENEYTVIQCGFEGVREFVDYNENKFYTKFFQVNDGFDILWKKHYFATEEEANNHTITLVDTTKFKELSDEVGTMEYGFGHDLEVWAWNNGEKELAKEIQSLLSRCQNLLYDMDEEVFELSETLVAKYSKLQKIHKEAQRKELESTSVFAAAFAQANQRKEKGGRRRNRK